MNMAKRRGERRSLSPSDFWSDREWDDDLAHKSFRHTLRSLSPLALSDLDFWDTSSIFKARKSPAWSSLGLSGSTLRSKINTSSLANQRQSGSLGMTRWSSASRLAPEGAPRSHSSAEDFELRAALEESSMRTAELIQRLREAKEHLDTQTDLLKTKGSQFQQNQNVSNVLEMKHKQLSEAVSALEQDKEAAELTRFEESRRRGELHDKVLQLEMDILKMRSNLERRTPPTSPNPLNRTLPATIDETLREAQRQFEKEIKKLREALRKAEETMGDLEYEKDSVLRQLHSSEEGKQEAIKQAEELEQRLSRSVQTRAELEEQLNESRSRLGQMELERDLFSTKARKLEDNLNDLKVKLSGALMDKDRLVQEKAELHQRIQTLDLELQREQRSKQGFSEHVCELHSEISQAKTQSNNQKIETILMKEELLSIKELNEKLSFDLTKATERLQVTLNQLHELEAQKLIQTNQIAALETERLQLIGEKEELRKTFDDGLHEKIRELGERYQHRELQGNMEQENHSLQLKCQDMEKKVHILEAEYKQKEEEHQCVWAEFEREKEELRKVAAHWNERWLDVAMTLCSTQAELDELKSQQQEDDKQEADVLEVPLDVCRQQIEPERDRSHVQQRLMSSSVSLEDMDGEFLQMKAELLRVKELLKIRDTELEEQLQELQSARTQVSQQSGEVQRLEQLLAERDQEIKEKDQDLKNLEIQRITEKAEAQIKLSALEQEIFGYKELQSREELVSKCSPKSLKGQLEEIKRRAKTLEEERDQELEKLNDVELPHQGKAEKESPPESKKQKPAGPDLADPNQQRRLVTEQLKSLFKERERHGERSPVFPRRTGLVDSKVQNTSSIKNRNAVDINHQGRKTQKLEQELQQRAAKGSSSHISVSQVGSKRSEKGEEHKQPTNQKHFTKTAQMSTVRDKKENLKERNENLLEAKVMSSQPNLQQDISPLGCKDGTFLARQVDVCDSDTE